MEDPQPARHTRTKRGIALLLTFAAGCVDIIGYLGFYTSLVRMDEVAWGDCGLCSFPRE